MLVSTAMATRFGRFPIFRGRLGTLRHAASMAPEPKLVHGEQVGAGQCRGVGRADERRGMSWNFRSS